MLARAVDVSTLATSSFSYLVIPAIYITTYTVHEDRSKLAGH